MACRRLAPRHELHRLVVDGDGAVTLDPPRTRPGRGAYVCDAACHAEAVRRGRYHRAFRRKVRAEALVVPEGPPRAQQQTGGPGDGPRFPALPGRPPGDLFS